MFRISPSGLLPFVVVSLQLEDGAVLVWIGPLQRQAAEDHHGLVQWKRLRRTENKIKILEITKCMSGLNRLSLDILFPL